MPITDQFPRVALASILIPREDRQRREVDTSGLQASIARIGVLQPLLVEVFGGYEPCWRLVAGERRLRSCLNLVAEGTTEAKNGQDLTTVPVRLASDLSRIDARVFELEENIKRSDLPWQDIVRAAAELHRLYKAQDPEWTQNETSEALSLTPGTTSLYLRVNENLADSRIAGASTVRSAYEVLARRDSRALGDALDELAEVPVVQRGAVESGGDNSSEGVAVLPPVRFVPASSLVPPPAEDILTESFLEWAPKYSGQPFNLVHCDFPYGVGLFDGPQGRGAEPGPGYTDTPEVFLELLECLCLNIDRVLSLSGHLMFWYSGKLETETRRVFATLAGGIEFSAFPLIWHKSDDKGIAGDWRREPRHVYETCLLGRRGGRQLLQVKSDLYASPTDRTLHASTKPEPMLRHFMSMLCDANTRMLDPTCGSGASLRAAESLGAKVLGLEIDPDAAETARRALRQSRTLRVASREL